MKSALTIFVLFCACSASVAQPPEFIPLVRGWYCNFSNVLGWKCSPDKDGKPAAVEPQHETQNPVSILDSEKFELQEQSYLGAVVGWHMNVGLGSPVQEVKILIDTGSADAWVVASSRGAVDSTTTSRLRGTRIQNRCTVYPEPNMAIGIGANRTYYNSSTVGGKFCAKGPEWGYDYHISASASVVDKYTFRPGYGTDSNCSQPTYDFLTNETAVGKQVKKAMHVFLSKKIKKNGEQVYPKYCPYGGIIVKDKMTPLPADVGANSNIYQDIATKRAAASVIQATTQQKGFNLEFQAVTQMPPGQAGGALQTTSGLLGLDQLSAIGPRAGQKRGDMTKLKRSEEDSIRRFTLYLPRWKSEEHKMPHPPALYLGPPPAHLYNGSFFECDSIKNAKDSLSDVWTTNMVGFATSDGKVQQGIFNPGAKSGHKNDKPYTLLNEEVPNDNVAVIDSGSSSTMIPTRIFHLLQSAYQGGIPEDITFEFAFKGGDRYRTVSVAASHFVAPPISSEPGQGATLALGISMPSKAEMEAMFKKDCGHRILCATGFRPMSLVKNDMKSMGWLMGAQWTTAQVHQFDFETGRVSMAHLS